MVYLILPSFTCNCLALYLLDNKLLVKFQLFGGVLGTGLDKYLLYKFPGPVETETSTGEIAV